MNTPPATRGQDGRRSISGGLAPEDLNDPYPTYRQLRQSGPLCRGAPRQWIVSHYAEVATLLRDRRLGHRFSDAHQLLAVGEKRLREFFQRILLFHDHHEHRRLRQLLANGLGTVAALVPPERIASLVDELLGPALDRGHLDAVSGLAMPLPMRLLGEAFALPAGDRASLQSLTIDLGRAFATQPSKLEQAAASAALGSLRAHIGRLLAERVGSGGEDVLSRLVAAEKRDASLTRQHSLDNAIFLLFAGYETTVNLIASVCAELTGHPDQLDRLRANPALAATAIEEVLRYDAPIQSVARVATESMEIAGRYVMRGRTLSLLIGSANRDERQFDSPDRLDVGRQPNPHLSFGGGIHQCLGAPLARVQTLVTLRRLLLRTASLEAGGEVVRLPAAGDRAYRCVPIAIKPA